MNEEIIRALSAELKITEDQVRNTLEMLSQGDTVPLLRATARNRQKVSTRSRSWSYRNSTTTS